MDRMGLSFMDHILCNLKSKWWNVWKKTCNGCQPCFGIDNKITSLPAWISLIPNWNIFPFLENFSIFGFCISLFFGIWFSKFSLILICDFLDWFEFHLTHRILTNRPMSRFSRTWVESTPCMNTRCTKNQSSHLILSDISGIYYQYNSHARLTIRLKNDPNQ